MWWTVLLVTAHSRYLFVPGALPSAAYSRSVPVVYAPAALPHGQRVVPNERFFGASVGVAAAAAALVIVAGRRPPRARVVANASEDTRDPAPAASYEDYLRSRGRGGKSEYEKYTQGRGQLEMDAVDEGYRTFKGIDQEFDGGDSGGGVVGDGNVDLEDQHNSATLGALRGGIADVTGATLAVGRGNVKSATESRTASAGANYFGRSTGLAEKIVGGMTDADLKAGKIDCVRAQQKENWFNQRAIHSQNKAQGQGVVFGQTDELGPSHGGFNTQSALSSDVGRTGHIETEISQADLNKHLHNLASAPAARLDGEEWSVAHFTAADDITESFQLRASPRVTNVTTIMVKNDLNTFAPFRCSFVGGSSHSFEVQPHHGTMNRRSGEAIEVVVRYTPEATGDLSEAALIFETEDMKKVYLFNGST